MSAELPTGWVNTVLADVAECQLGKMLDKAKHKDGEFLPYLRNINVRWGSVDLGDLAQMPFREEEKERFSIRNGDILICEGGEPGRSAIWNYGQTEIKFQKALHRVRPEQGILPQFIAHRLRHDATTGSLFGYLTGSTIKHFPGEALARYHLPLPPTPEQQRIIAKIDSLFARSSRARDELVHIPKLIERYRQSVLEAAFRGDLTADWRSANSDSDAIDLTADKLVGEPIRNGLSVRGSDAPPGIPALRLSALRRSAVDMADVRYLPITTQQAQRFLLREGDVLISRGNGNKNLVARSSIVPSFSKPTIFPDTAFRLRLNKHAVDPEWFSLLWNAPQVRAQIEALAKTTAGIWKVSQSDITAVVLRVPPLSEQLETVKRIKSNFSAINVVEAELNRSVAHLDRLDQSILDKAFTGKLVPQDPADEPASKLLERIQTARAAAPKAKRGRRKAAT